MSDALEPDLLQCQDRGPDPHRGTVQMPPVTRLARLVRIVTLPETRGVIFAAARSETLRDIRQRAVHDRARSCGTCANPRTRDTWFAAPPDTRPPASSRVRASCFCHFDISRWVGRRHGWPTGLSGVTSIRPPPCWTLRPSGPADR